MLCRPQTVEKPLTSHAMFTLDRDGMITNINQQAKHDFGLYSRSGSSHGPGRLEPGDVIIIGGPARSHGCVFFTPLFYSFFPWVAMENATISKLFTGING